MFKMIQLAIKLTLIAITSESVSNNLIENDDPSKYPFVASINIFTVHVCSGIILTKNYVLGNYQFCTRIFSDPSSLQVRLNTSSVNSLNEGYDIGVKAIHVHPKFQFSYSDYDAAILELEEFIDFGLGVKTAQLSTSSLNVPAGAKLQHLGFKNTSLTTWILGINETSLLTTSECKSKYHFGITGAILCATGGDNDNCIDDHGGALLTNNNVLGIYSWRRTDVSNQTGPLIYTSISTIQDFITNITSVKFF